jgi:hypothetical protein
MYNTEIHPENKAGKTSRRGYYTAGGFVASEPRTIETGFHVAPELFLFLPILVGIIILVSSLV